MKPATTITIVLLTTMSLVLAQSVVKPKRPIAGDLVGFISPGMLFDT